MSNQGGQVPIEIGGEHAELIQLLDWFRRDDALRGRAQLHSQPPRDGQMGGVADVVTVALGAGGAGTVLVSSLRAWFATRHSDLSLSLTLPDGTEVSLDANRVKQKETFEHLQRLLDSQTRAR
ncbi:effector-associated constant component EACC1 [Nocardia asteroides]|uniref:effector-associated constant component EACC1 n=1 Tax=Nocardia asteroides TaxID=1824 RepID=UPI001E5F5156|nr:hypothetical protein [Nocardia asteroides]UGT60349.1 hypothetical protein LTT61_24595 [Nocardia asteroides]